MCCFSRPIRSVTGTNIFARSGPNSRQYVVYSMRLNTAEDVAMILPIPIKQGTGEQAVHFIDLHDYPTLFDDLRLTLYPPPPAQGTLGMKGAATASARPLEVHEVGSFEASYVPTVHDFSRLDPRFRLPDSAWDKLPQYRKYGFTVFRLKKGLKTIHPMAFDFPRADAARLFFPTVHIHDGKVHDTASFDHFLYSQKSEGDRFSLATWKESNGLASASVRTRLTQSIVLPNNHLYLHVMRGRMPNQDTWIG